MINRTIRKSFASTPLNMAAQTFYQLAVSSPVVKPANRGQYVYAPKCALDYAAHMKNIANMVFSRMEQTPSVSSTYEKLKDQQYKLYMQQLRNQNIDLRRISKVKEGFYRLPEELHFNLLTIEEETNHLREMAAVSGHLISGTEIINRLSKMMELEKSAQLLEIKNFIRLLGFYPMASQEKELNLFAEKISSQKNRDDIKKIIIDKYVEENCPNLTIDNFNSQNFISSIHATANMCAMTAQVLIGESDDDHYAQRVDPLDRPQDSIKIFYSPLLLANSELPVNFEQYLELYKKTNTGNIEKDLISRKKINIYLIPKGTSIIQQEILRTDIGKTSFTEGACPHEAKKFIVEVNVDRELPIDLGNGYLAIISYADAKNIKERCQGIDSKSTDKSEIKKAIDIAKQYIVEQSNEEFCGIKVYKGDERINISDFATELSPQQTIQPGL